MDFICVEQTEQFSFENGVLKENLLKPQLKSINYEYTNHI